MELHEIVALLKPLSLFATFTENELNDFVKQNQLTTFEKGELILDYAQKSTVLHILLDGTVKASIVDNAGHEVIFDRYESGSLLGHTSLFTNEPSRVSLIASERVSTFEICEANVTKLKTDKPQVFASVQKDATQLHAQWGEKTALLKTETSDDPCHFNLKTDVSRKILVINCGSSSLKYTLFDTDKTSCLVNGQIDRIGTGAPMGLSYATDAITIEKDLPDGDHKTAFDAMIAALMHHEHGVISDPTEITAIGHRVVHGGDIFYMPTLLTEETIAQIESISTLAPLHNPVNIVGIREAIAAFPQAVQVAVFDTAFHHTIPPHAFLYALPYEYYTEKKIRRYGFHGTSHYYVSLKTAEYLNQPYRDLKIISCHLGNGGSICAIDHGKSVDTSMGLTPAEGVIMGTRCGNIDPAALLHLMDSENMTSADLNTLLNKRSGLLGLSGVSNDMRDIEAAAKEGNYRAVTAYKAFAYSVKKYIGAYNATLGGADILLFTGGIGLYSSFIRKEICAGLENIGMKIDNEKNCRSNGTKEVAEISMAGSPIRILIVPTNEELMIARETLGVITEA